MNRMRYVLAFSAMFLVGCGSGSGSSHDSAPSCGPVIQNVNVPQTATIPADQLESTERATDDNGGVILSKDFNPDNTITLTGCQIVTTGDTNTDDDTNQNHSGNSNGGNA